MRVLVLTPWYPRGGDGAGSFVEDQVRAMHGSHEVAVAHITASSGRPVVREDRGTSWPVVRSSPPSMPGAFAIRDALGVAAAVRHLRNRGFSPEVMHAHVYSAGFATLPVARLLGAPLVLSEHHSGVALGHVSRRSRFAAKVAYSRADLVCPPSASLGTAVARIAPKARISVVPNPVDTRMFSPDTGEPRARSDTRRVLAVSSFAPVKGVDTLIDAVAHVARHRRDFRLVLIGDGPGRAECERRARSMEAAELVEFAGRRPRREVAAAMRDADFLVVPSRWETFSVATAEALCCGLPVLATRVGALPDLVDDSSGLLVDASDVGALAGGIEAMLDAARGFDRLAIARRAAQRWSEETVRRTWREIYARLLAARGV